MASKQTRLIIILVAVLLAVVAASALVLRSTPGRNLPETTAVLGETPLPTTSPETTSSGSVFNLKVLQKAGYALLDKRLLNEKALPVQAPATVGKANPFL